MQTSGCRQHGCASRQRVLQGGFKCTVNYLKDGELVRKSSETELFVCSFTCSKKVKSGYCWLVSVDSNARFALVRWFSSHGYRLAPLAFASLIVFTFFTLTLKIQKRLNTYAFGDTLVKTRAVSPCCCVTALACSAWELEDDDIRCPDCSTGELKVTRLVVALEFKNHVCERVYV